MADSSVTGGSPFDRELTSWVRTYTAELLSWASRRTGDAAAAEDLVQETFMAAAERIADFRRESQPRTWLYAILNKRIAEHYRKKARMPMSPWEGEDPADALFAADGHWRGEKAPRDWDNPDVSLFDDPEFVQIFEECLSDLPGNWHGCLTSKFFQHRSPEEICQELGISTTNYWQMIHRAKLKLRNCIEARWFKEQ